MVALEFLDGLSSGSSTARSISANGLVIVGQSTSLSAKESFPSGQEAFRWSAEGGMVALGDIPGGDFFSSASDVSADGDVVVGYGRPGQGVQSAFRWTSTTGLVQLSDLAGGDVYGGASAVSADGNVAVGQGDNGTYEAVRWVGMAAPIVLGDLPPDPNGNSAAGGVSGDGSVIVGFAGGPGFRWTETGGMVPTPGFYPTDVSASGLTMAGGDGYFWRLQDIAPRNLLDFLLVNGVVSAVGWSDLYISAISDDGEWLVGGGTNALGDREAFVANIEPVPIPPAAWLFGFALGLMGWMRRKATVAAPGGN
jgi:probable HAF family extracellular repeat protein